MQYTYPATKTVQEVYQTIGLNGLVEALVREQCVVVDFRPPKHTERFFLTNGHVGMSTTTEIEISEPRLIVVDAEPANHRYNCPCVMHQGQ